MPARKNRVTWVRPPAHISANLGRYGQKVEAATVAVAEFIGAKMQNYARANAPWQDRTGNARSGLFYQVVREAARKLVIVYLAHTVFYGKFLELSHGERYAIIWPTIEKHLSELEKMLDDIFKG